MKSTITCDLEGIIRTYNEGAQEVFGYAPDEVIGKKRVSLFSPGLVVLQSVDLWLKAAREHQVYEGKSVFIRKNGSRFPARIRITPTYKDGIQTGYCGVTEPIEEDVTVPVHTSTRLLAWLVITRAPFLTAALMPVLIGGAFAARFLPAGTPFPVGFYLAALVGVACLHLASNVFNDYFDWKSGTDQANASYFQKFSGGSRAIELGLIDERGTWRLGWGLLIFSTLLGIYLTWQVGPGVLALGLTGAAAGFFYTAPPVRLVARHGLGELAIGLAFGPLNTLGIFYVVTGGFDGGGMAFLAGVPVGLLTTNILMINQVPDLEGDASTGKNHLVVTLGRERTPLLYGSVLGLAALVHAGVVLTFPEAGWLWWLPFAALVVIGGGIIRYIRRHLESRLLVRANARTIQLNIVYGVLWAGVLLLR
jgi:1,4-dihydroxy-2-naphthoate octaprenyltransferase